MSPERHESRPGHADPDCMMDAPPTPDPTCRPTGPPLLPVRIALLGTLVSLIALGATAVTGDVAGATVAPSRDRAGSDPVAAAQEQLRQAGSARERADATLARVAERRASLDAMAASLDSADAVATARLAVAHRNVRELAVAAYIDGGRSELLQASLAPDEAVAVAWRVGVVTGGAGTVSEALGTYRRLAAADDDDRRRVAEQLDRARAEEADATSAVVQASASERDAAAAVEAARVARAASTPQAVPSGSGTAAAGSSAEGMPTTGRPRSPVSRSAGPAANPAGLGVAVSGGPASAEELAFLAKVRACESRGDYTIVNPSGRYRGAYQFSVQTWKGVGGAGDPAAASPQEQDARALALLRLQGRRAWPVCGR